MDEELHKHKNNSSSEISIGRKKKLRKKALIFEQPDITGASEIDLSSVILNRTVKDKFTFQSET